jgi:hypothetical protein
MLYFSLQLGLSVLKELYSGYGSTVDYELALSGGKQYFRLFPKLDYIKRARFCPTLEGCHSVVEEGNCDKS